MSMICWLLGVSPAQIAALNATPSLARDVASVASNDAHDKSMAPFLATMTPQQRQAREAQERADREAFPELNKAEARLAEARKRVEPIGLLEKTLCLEKSWHMLHYLMTGHVDGGAAPGDALLTGTPLGDDVGYGPARLHDADETRSFARFLETVDIAALQRRVDLRTMRDEGLYGLPRGGAPDAKHEADLRAEVGHYVPTLRDYVAAMAGKGYGLLIWLN